MNLDDFMIACFCLIDDVLLVIMKGKRLRTRGPMPKLSDSEVLMMEVVGAYLGLSQDKALYDYFRRHDAHCFPMMGPTAPHDLCEASRQLVGHQRTVVVLSAR